MSTKQRCVDRSKTCCQTLKNFDNVFTTGIKWTRYDYNLRLWSLKSPKPATDNRFKKQIKSYLWNRTMLNFCGIVDLWWPFWKWRPVEIVRCQESIQVIIIYLHMQFRWNRTMLNLCGIAVAILKMATGRNFSMSGINSGHHNLPTYEMSLKSDNVEFVRYCGGHIENGDR